MNIGFIGTGEIASAMVQGLTGDGHAILVSDRNREHATELGTLDDVTVADNQGVLDGADMVFLCLMAGTARTALPDLTFRAEHKIISVMVDVDLEALAGLCAPATDFAITIPMPFIAGGGCPLPVYPDSNVLRSLFGDDNTIIPLQEEAAMNPHFAASALSSVIFSLLETGSDWLAGHTGDAQGAEKYVAALFAGYFRGLPTDGSGRFADIISALSSEGGLNATLREHVRTAGAHEALMAGLDGFEDRLGLRPRL